MGIRKVELREQVIAMRLAGDSYDEILRSVPIARSTLALWLHSVSLAEHQRQRITELKKSAQRRGAQARRTQRINKTQEIQSAARKEVAKLIANPLWLTGVVLYWGEGSKEKAWKPGRGVALTNMDIRMHRLFLTWLKSCADISDDQINFELYIHMGHGTAKAKRYWATGLNVSEKLIKTYFKKPNDSPKRKNIGEHYYGVLRTQVSKSADLNRKIAGWTDGVIEYLR